MVELAFQIRCLQVNLCLNIYTLQMVRMVMSVQKMSGNVID